MGIITILMIISNILSGGTTDNLDIPPTGLTREVSSPNSVNEVLWLARIIYSETKVPEEMSLVAWVARNRKDTGYRGDITYKSVALSKKQFSGLNSSDPEYKNNIGLGYTDTKNKSWVEALEVAREVYYSHESLRPFPKTVRHFYSPKSVMKKPYWTKDGELFYSVSGEYGKPARFAFYNKVK